MKGNRLKFRALELEDIDLLYQWENEPEIWADSNTLTPFSKQVLKAYLQNAQLDIYASKQLRLVICLNTGEPIGCIDLFEFDPSNLKAGVGILIADKSDRKNGYATEALGMLKSYCKEKLNLHQLYCHIGVSNKASIQLFEKSGFIQTGNLKDWQRNKNVFEDVYFYQCIL